jgi:hypothetical protein
MSVNNGPIGSRQFEATNYWSKAPGMRVSVPGMAPVTIGCRDSVSGLDSRFSWPDNVPAKMRVLITRSRERIG